MKQHQTLRRGLGILLALTMGLCLLAATALAETMQTADFTVSPTDALNRLKYNNKDKVEWDNDTKTLTLKGLDYAVTADIAVKLPADSTIVLEAGTENTIKSTNTDNTSVENSYGIYCDGNLTITGSGTLNVTGGAAKYWSNGIYVKGNLTINSGTVNANGGGNAKSSYGINAEVTVEITGGTVIAKGSNSTKDSLGIHAGDVKISGGTVTAIGGNSNLDNSESVGIYAYCSITIYGDNTVVNATGGTAKSGSYGIWAENYYEADVTISGGTVTAKGSAAAESYGIRTVTHGSDRHTTISGGQVIAEGTSSALDHAPDLSNYTNYQWRTVSSDGFTFSTVKPYTYSTAHTYVEFDKASTVITGDQTADFTGDTATALALLTKGDGSKATWDSTTNTLTLKGVDFSTTADIAVKLPGGSTIVLAEGTKNIITSTFESASDDSFSYGILVEGGNLTIEGGGQLAVTGGTAQYSDGIVVFSGSLTIDSGTVTATGGTAKVGSYGIYTDHGVTINGGIVNATGGKSGDGSHGIATNRDVTITGGTVIARGGNGGYSSYGINTGSSCACTVTGGDVTAIGGNASERSYGIDSRQYITISGGHVTAQTLGDASTAYRSALHCAPDLSAYTGCYWRTGPDDYYNDTAYPYSQAHTYVEFAPEGKLAPNTTNLNDLPKTGDNSNVLLWIALLLASSLGVTVVYGRKSKTAK